MYFLFYPINSANGVMVLQHQQTDDNSIAICKTCSARIARKKVITQQVTLKGRHRSKAEWRRPHYRFWFEPQWCCCFIFSEYSFAAVTTFFQCHQLSMSILAMRGLQFSVLVVILHMVNPYFLVEYNETAEFVFGLSQYGRLEMHSIRLLFSHLNNTRPIILQRRLVWFDISLCSVCPSVRHSTEGSQAHR